MLDIRAPTMVQNRKAWLIYPNDKCKAVYWDVFVSIVLMITLFQTPITLAFADELDSIVAYSAFTYSIDLIFLIDIFVCFNTACLDEKNNVIDDRWIICRTYLTGWFIIDIVSIMPFDLMFPQPPNPGEATGNASSVNDFARFSKVSRLYKLVKVTRLFRFFKLMKKGNKVTSKIGSAA